MRSGEREMGGVWPAWSRSPRLGQWRGHKESGCRAAGHKAETTVGGSGPAEGRASYGDEAAGLPPPAAKGGPLATWGWRWAGTTGSLKLKAHGRDRGRQDGTTLRQQEGREKSLGPFSQAKEAEVPLACGLQTWAEVPEELGLGTPQGATHGTMSSEGAVWALGRPSVGGAWGFRAGLRRLLHRLREKLRLGLPGAGRSL